MSQTAALIAPRAPYTRAVAILLARTVASSNRVGVKFPRASEIVGITSTVVAVRPLAGGGLIVPTRDDLLVDISVDDNTHFGAMDPKSDVARGSNYSDLSAQDIQAPRVVSIPVEGSAEIGFELRWKQFVQGTPIYEDALVVLNLFYRPISVETLQKIREENAQA